MNGEIKRRWIEALRSGDYRQDRGQLCSITEGEPRPSYCCLGVLTELAAVDGVVERVVRATDHRVLFEDPRTGEWNGNYLMSAILNWAELPESDVDPMLGDRSAASWNDGQRYTFAEIANLIEEHL